MCYAVYTKPDAAYPWCVFNELELDRERPTVVHCSIGHRSGLGVSVLLRAGFTDVRNLLGGMTAWKRLGLPTE